MVELTDLDKKITEVFDGCVVRKDLVKEVKSNAKVPIFVLEYLLGQYCASSDEDTIRDGLETVKNTLSKHYVDREKAEYIKSTIQVNGSHRIIDKVSASLDEKKNCYIASFSNLGVDKVNIPADYAYKKYPRLLVTPIWCIADLEWQYSEVSSEVPYVLNMLKPIQLASFDFEEFKEKRKQFTTEEWIDLIIRSIGFNPEFLSKRKKLLQLIRLIPYCENNYNLIELGPPGTGKTHIYTEFSPHGTLISGSEITLAKLFVNNSKKHDIGLVGCWDNIAFDEFAKREKKVDSAVVTTMQNYMENRSFSRGGAGGTLYANASMSFVGNTKHNVPYMLKHSNLFEELPKGYLVPAFLDRLHFYLPGWEVDITRKELFNDSYGFISDYYSEALKVLRDENGYSNLYQQYFKLSSNLKGRDENAITKTFSGLMKIIYPHKEATMQEIEEILKFSIEGRKRVKDQIIKIDPSTESVDFYYEKSGERIQVKTLEELQYPHLYRGTISDDSNLETNDQKETDLPIQNNTVNQSENKIVEELKETHKVIEEEQTGITYENLFGKYLKGATKITIEDAYIRSFHQTLNLMEFIELIEKLKAEEDLVTVELITVEDEFNNYKQIENFDTIQESCLQMGIEFSYKFDSSIHARSITTNTGWKISLDRGLDIYQNCERKDAFQYTSRLQKYRPCKRFEITYIKIS